MEHAPDLPVQALDHANGYLMAAAVVRGLTRRLTTDCGCEARTSLVTTPSVPLRGYTVPQLRPNICSFRSHSRPSLVDEDQHEKLI